MSGVKKIFPANKEKNETYPRPHPDPKFFRNDTKLLSSLIRDLRRKLEINADWWQSEGLHIFYAASCFPEGSVAKKTVDSGFKAVGTIIHKSVKDIIKLLQKAFGDINEQETSQGKIKTCLQRNESLATFSPNWLANAEISGFYDCALISFLKEAIYPDIKSHNSYIVRSDMQTMEQRDKEARVDKPTDPILHNTRDRCITARPKGQNRVIEL